MIGKKADVNARDGAGRIPLHLTGDFLRQDVFKESDESVLVLKNMILGWSRKTIRILKEQGADLQAKDKNGKTPSQTIPPEVLNEAMKKLLAAP